MSDYEQLALFDVVNTDVVLWEADDALGPVFLANDACPACVVGAHSECYHPHTSEDDRVYCCCPSSSNDEVPELDSYRSELPGFAGEEKTTVDRIKEASAITDVTSTGRKRAALAYPITEGMICEWAKLKSSGGGVKPIIGCAGNAATDRHHGPDKNTLNNTEGNVHRICADCHNRWHAANDEYYGQRPPGTEPFIPLDGNSWTQHNSDLVATDQDIVNNEIYWRTKKKGKRTNE